ncbi:MAG: DM13 domain-containing protein [Acidimicrobiales bacterium]
MALVAGVYLAFGYFGVHKLFVDDEVDEAGPVFDSGASASEPTTGVSDDPDRGADGDASQPVEADEADAPSVTDLAIGQFSGDGRYSGTGTVTVLTDGTDQRFVRFDDDFATDNGPDLFVYLGTGSGEYGEPSQYVRLGTLKGNIGSQNYEIPAVHPVTGEPIDLDVFDHVAVWCQRFDATFAVAQLS